LTNLDRFSNFFFAGLDSKLATKRLSQFPPHLKRVVAGMLWNTKKTN